MGDCMSAPPEQAETIYAHKSILLSSDDELKLFFFDRFNITKLPKELKELCIKYIGPLTFQYPLNSSLATRKEKYFLINALQKQLKCDNITLNLLWRSSVDSDVAKSFHQRVDGMNNLIFLMEPKHNHTSMRLPVFGGYTSIVMTSENNLHRDQKMFCFRLSGNPYILNDYLHEAKIYFSEYRFSRSTVNHVLTHPDSFITFETNDQIFLHIHDQCHMRRNYAAHDPETLHCTTWLNDTIGSDATKEKIYFRIKDLEVFQVFMD